jgi:formylglycine-generating enzyme required for sulfatase activity
LQLTADPEIERRLETGLRAAGALARIGLDPEAFAIDPISRPTPFPGLSSFEDEDADAALFYGRSREIAEVLEGLRKMRAAAERQPFVVFGASGAGKSSLLKAGIIPRLRREAPAWLPLRAFRPGANPLLNFAKAISRTMADFGTLEANGLIRDRLLDGWSGAERDPTSKTLTPAGLLHLESALESEGARLRKACGHAGASILLSVDQAEEIAEADGESSEALADYLRAAVANTAVKWQLIFTVRTDRIPELQSHRRFQDLKARGYDLRALPNFRFDSVVEEPAKRYGVAVESALVDAMMSDAPKEDSLPLLAFALERLWRQYAVSKTLTKTHYDRVGGLRGLIEDAAERAMRGLAPGADVPLPSGPLPKHLTEFGASTFVPPLVEVNEKGATARRIAAWSNFTDEQRVLLSRFEDWRLLVRKGEGTIEVAHEALFREWTRLNSWLEPERVRLDALRSLEVDALTWDRNGRDSGFLNHRDKRLAEVITVANVEAYRKRLGETEFDYIAACQLAERLHQTRARRIRTVVYVLLVGIVAGLFCWTNQAFLAKQWRWYTVTQPYMKSQIQPRVLKASEEASLKPGKAFQECLPTTACPEMVVIPEGSFDMGASDIEAQEPGYENQIPQHKVAIPKPFAVSRNELTFADWDACVRYGDCNPIDDAGYGRGLQPVINVSWGDAQQYVCGGEWDNRAPAPVGRFQANAFGLLDMHGNVWEWVEDCWNENYDNLGQDASPKNGDCTRRVSRGGSWDYPPQYLRSAFRSRNSPGLRVSNLGFRIARDLAR